MILRSAGGGLASREAAGKGKDVFRLAGTAKPALPRLQRNLERTDNGAGQALAGQTGQFRGEQICPGVLQIQTLQNSTSNR